MENDNLFYIDIDADGKTLIKQQFIVPALEEAEWELQSINESIESIKSLRPDCDKIDYTLAACSGALCGMIDVFLVGTPNDSALNGFSDKFAAECTKKFAKILGWKPRKDSNLLKSAIGFLERKFSVPYDQTSLNEPAKTIFFTTEGGEELLNTKNHHFLSLSHNPSLLGLFFAILDQFQNTSHFVIQGDTFVLSEAKPGFQLRGETVPAKIFYGFINWFGHVMSDVSGSSGSKGRGAGIPSPFWTWTNDIIAIKSNLGISASEFDLGLQKLAIDIYEEGFDARFTGTQAIPVLVNELLVKTFYRIRRIVHYYHVTPKDDRTFKDVCSLFRTKGNPSVLRLLTVAHGTFCLIDIGDATIRGLIKGGGECVNPVEFCLRLNVAGLGRFTICLFGEVKQGVKILQAKKEVDFNKRRKQILLDYIGGLHQLEELYDDEKYMSFVNDLENHDFVVAFNKSSDLAEHRGGNPLKTKNDIDNYFSRKN